jgi:hypothetical protein
MQTCVPTSQSHGAGQCDDLTSGGGVTRRRLCDEGDGWVGPWCSGHGLDACGGQEGRGTSPLLLDDLCSGGSSRSRHCYCLTTWKKKNVEFLINITGSLMHD